MVTLLIFIGVLAVLVISHEFGHFIVAKQSGMRVDEFGFGFPPRFVGIRRYKKNTTTKSKPTRWEIVWGNRKRASRVDDSDWQPGTLYSFNWLPLGGFVKIKGENGDKVQESDSFGHKPIGVRILVVVAGVVMNMVVAWLLISISLMAGVPQAADDTARGAHVSQSHIQIMEVVPGKPAEAAGIVAGDTILALDGREGFNLKELQEYVNDHRDQTITVVVERNKARLTKLVHPVVASDTGRGVMGVAIAEVVIARYPWYSALYYGARVTAYDLKAIGAALYRLFADLFTGVPVDGMVSGPVGVAVLTGQAARIGFLYLLQFMALLSLNLAILNILPIPALDGGRLLFLILHALFRRPVAAKYEQAIHTVGFMALLVLVLAVSVRDVITYKTVLAHFFKGLF